MMRIIDSVFKTKTKQTDGTKHKFPISHRLIRIVGRSVTLEGGLIITWVFAKTTFDQSDL